MSGLAGFYRRDGGPVDSGVLRRMMTAVAHRGPDGSNCQILGPAGLGHLMLHTTPESLGERQPVADETGRVVLALDGRVDNRDELRSALQSRGVSLRSETDAEFVLRAYLCWGDTCPARIIGDFAFVIWDGRLERLVCARDPFGMKPLLFVLTDRVFLWASEPQALFEWPHLSLEPNEGMVGEYLANAVTDQEETLLRGVRRLPPAHVMTVGRNDVKRRRYWEPDLSELRYSSDADYAEHCRVLLREAVRCRLRCNAQVASHLSGGVDSSSVAATALSLVRSNGAANRGFATVRMTFPGMDEADETEYVRAFERAYSVSTTEFAFQEPDCDAHVAHVRRYLDFPDFPNGEQTYIPTYAWLRSRCIKALQTGHGGDQWFTGGELVYADFIRRMRLLELARRAWHDARIEEPRWSPLLVLTAGVAPLVPRRARSMLRRILRRNPVPSWIDPAFARRIHLADRLRPREVPRPYTSYAQEYACRFLESGWERMLFETLERTASWYGFEFRHPFYDRRVVEFALSLPESQRRRGVQFKFVLREAMKSLLPEVIRTRPGKASFDPLTPGALATVGGAAAFSSLAVASAGWVDGARVKAMYAELAANFARGSDAYIVNNYPLWMLFGVNCWFQAIFSDRKAVESGCRADQDLPGPIGVATATGGR